MGEQQVSIDEAEEPLGAMQGAHLDAVVTHDSAAQESVTFSSPADIRLDLLLNAGAFLDDSVDYEVTLRELARYLVPRLADLCVVEMVDPDGALRVLTLAHVAPTKRDRACELARCFRPLVDGEGGVLRTGRSRLCRVPPDEVLIAAAKSAEPHALLREVATSSVLVVALRAGARILGAITVVSAESGRVYDEIDLKLVEKLGSRATLAVEHARLLATEHAARRDAEEAARRIERLQSMTSSLSAALDMGEIGDLVVRSALAIFNGQRGVLAEIIHDKEVVEIANSFGYPKDLLLAWQDGSFCVDSHTPLCEAIRTGKIVVCETREETDRRYPAVDLWRRVSSAEACLAAPIVFEGRVLGALGVTFDDPRRFSEEDLALATTLTGQAAQALERARLFESERRARRETGLLYTLADAVSKAEDLSEVYAPALDAIERAFALDRSSIALLDSRDAKRFKASRGLSEAYLEALEGASPWSRGTNASEAIVIEEVQRDPRIARHGSLFESEGIRALAFVPLVHGNKLLGELAVYSSGKLRADGDTLRLAATIGRQVAQAVSKRASEAQIAKLYAEAEVARGAAEAASRMKDEFLAVVSHELRTPLAAISGWAALLRGERRKDPVAVAKGLDVIDRNAKAQTKLIEDILDVSRIITGELVLDPRPVSLLGIVNEALDSTRASANAKGITVALACSGDAYTVVGDPDRLRQIAWNLLSNAMKFTPANGRVEVRLERSQAGVDLIVADNGKGIAPAFLPHVFERFRQADSSTTRRDGGVGLGLAIVRHLVELHGGSVAAESAGVGLGATFTVTFPMDALSLEPPSDEGHASGQFAALGSREDEILAGLRVLLVDDERDARELLSELMTSLGATVETASSAVEALEAIPRFEPDVLISDIGMPIHDGYTLIRRVRELAPPHGGLPAIALTAYARGQDAAEAVTAGFDRHLTKPTTSAALVAAIERSCSAISPATRSSNPRASKWRTSHRSPPS